MKKIISFSNPLDEQCFRPEMVCIQPDLEGETIELNQSQIKIDGKFLYRTTYTLTLSPEICDIHGQTLGEAQTFHVIIRPEEAGFWFPTEVLLTLDPFGPPELPVFTVNIPTIAIQLYQVKPSDWYAYLALHEQQARYETPSAPPGWLKSTLQLVPHPDPDRLVETRIDLNAVLPEKTGHILAVVQEPEPSNRPKIHLLWIQVTHLAADVTWEVTQLRIWANELTTGKPVSQARVTMLPEGFTSQTNSHGETSIQLSKKSVARRGTLLVEKGRDSVLVIEVQYLDFEPQNWSISTPNVPIPLWYIVHDRRGYQPGETVTIKGWVRSADFRSNQRLKNIPHFAKRLKFRAIDSKGNELTSGITTLTKLGGFHCQFPLPRACSPGAGSVHFALELQVKKGEDSLLHTSHSFQIESSPPPAVNVFVDTPPKSQVQGTQRKLTAQSQPFSPSNWQGYQFGSTHAGQAQFLVHPSTRYVGLRSTWNFAERGQDYPVELIVTDLDGVAQPNQKIELNVFRLDTIFAVRASASEKLVHQETLFSADHPVLWKVPAPENGLYRVIAQVWDDQGRINRSEIVFLQLGECTAQNRFMKYLEPERITAIPNKPAFRPGDIAEIKIEAPFAPAEGRLTVSNGRVLESRRIFLNSRSGVVTIPVTRANVPTLNIVLDLVGTTSRHQSQPEPKLPPRPVFATTRLTLDVEPVHQKLSVTVTHQNNHVISEKSAVVDVEIRDAQGRPVNQAECAFLVMDASRGTTPDFPISHPLEHLFQLWGSNSYFFHSRQTVNLFPFDQPGSLPPGNNAKCAPYQNWKRTLWNKMQRRPKDSEDWNCFPPPFIPYREPPSELDLILDWPGPFIASEASSWSLPAEYLEFDSPLVAFFPTVTTNKRGQSRISLTLPENVTRYRIIVIAAAGNDQFGIGETSF
ncbi:MAG: hypothetical protein HY774_07955 [Acidobacteria bacterium]|nr:hypothetical protein [Acidobacteriota bacterium]